MDEWAGAQTMKGEPMRPNDKVSAVLVVLLEAAQGAGMTMNRAKAIYEEMCAHYSNMKDGFSTVLLEEVAKVLALDAHDDAWIIEHAEELKAELLELAKAGAPRPEPGTLLGRALELFTDSDQ